METLMAKWKTTMDSQKKRHNQRNFSADPPDSELSDNEYIKFQAQKIIDIISTSQEPLSCTLYSVTKFQQVCDILQRVMSKEKTKEKPGKKKSEKKPEKIPEKTNDFESKVSELEREKIYLRRENQEMKKQISELQERIAQGKVTEEVIGMLKEAQIKVANANTLLNEDIKLLKQAQYDKDRLWELELEDIQKAMSLAFPVNK